MTELLPGAAYTWQDVMQYLHDFGTDDVVSGVIITLIAISLAFMVGKFVINLGRS